MDDDSGSRGPRITFNINNYKLVLELCRIKDLKPHERTIDKLTHDLYMEIVEDGFLKDPIIADIKRGLVIDGAHRLYVLRELKLEYIPVINIDYMDPRLKLYRWLRFYEEEIVLDNWLKGEWIEGKYLHYLYPLYSITYNGREFRLWIISRGRGGLMDVMEEMRVTEDKIFEVYRLKPKYISENECEEIITGSRPREFTLLIYRAISKLEVLDAFENGLYLHPKTTRHVPPYRIINIRLPLEFLNMDKLKYAVRHLENIRLRYLGERLTINGRYYEEKVYAGEWDEDKG